MLRLTIIPLALLALSSSAFAGLRECGFAMANIGVVRLNQTAPTDVRGLPLAALSKIAKSLRGYYVQVNVQEINPSGQSYGKTESLFMRVSGTEEAKRNGQRVLKLIGSTGHFNTIQGEVNSGVLFWKEIPFNDIVSIRLVADPDLNEAPEIRVSLLNLYKPDGRPRLLFNTHTEENIVTMAEGDSDAALVLGKIMAAAPFRVKDVDQSFDDVVRALDLANIRGRQIAAAYSNYAYGRDENLRIHRFVEGILLHIGDVVRAVNKSMGQKYDHVAVDPYVFSDVNR